MLLNVVNGLHVTTDTLKSHIAISAEKVRKALYGGSRTVTREE